MMQLYDFDLSGNCYKVRLMLGLLRQHYERVPVDLRGGEQRSEAFLRLNPKGQVPVLVDGEAVIADSQAILVYLARRYGEQRWLAQEPVAEARVQFWLSTAANEVQNGIATTRLVKFFGFPGDYEAAYEKAQALLELLDSHLTGRDWLEGERPTVADVAVYPYVAFAPDGEVSLQGASNVRRWIAGIEALPGYTPLPRAPAEV